MMRLLILHNFYQQPGGEDTVFEAESALLGAHGHEVIRYTVNNDAINRFNIPKVLLDTFWSRKQYREVRDLIRSRRPDVVHLHNFFPLLSPSVIHAARAEGVPVVMSLHNARLLCPQATFFRQGKLCTECLGKRFAWPGVVHECYHNSVLATATVAGMSAYHNWLGTWRTAVNRFVVFTPRWKDLFVQGGIPADKITIKPHFVDADPGPVQPSAGYALFVGRLDPEKGIMALLTAWRKMAEQGLRIPLKIRGAGKMESEVTKAIRYGGLEHVEVIPWLERHSLQNLVRKAAFSVWPSEGYCETFGLVAIESLAAGVPVIASRIGTGEDLISNGETGVHFTPGDAVDLANKVTQLWQNPQRLEAMRDLARQAYLKDYTAERNYQLMLDLYASVQENGH
jgi:glycosyltransferase involved in cell wall biosynthesis